MSPKAIEFNREAVLAAAVDVVRRQGLAGLSARSVAARLKASTAPVYSVFRSMADLERGVLEAVRRLMDDRTRLAYTDIPFLNMGVGIVTFARDEPRLFSALFHSKHPFQDILTSFHRSVLARMQEDAMLKLLPISQLERLLDSIWLYTLGLGTALVFGYEAGRRDEDLIRLLRDMGNVLMFVEATGIADSHSPESEKAWRRVFEERGIPVPAPSEGPGCPKKGGRTSARSSGRGPSPFAASPSPRRRTRLTASRKERTHE